jgi:1,4-alpha-glucan branching enzyme
MMTQPTAPTQEKEHVTYSAAFELFAPYNESVKLLGNWNDWQPIEMHKDDTGHWRVEVDLPDGEYQYKFEVISLSYFARGETKVIADPKAMRFSLDSRENAIITLKEGKRVIHNYQWKYDDVALPSNQELVIYEMHVGDFRGGEGDNIHKPGTFKTIIGKLDYLKDLGINAIELMPVNEFPGEHSWGYALNSIYAVENSYGTPDELCQLVDECHKRGIRVIHDAVYNHMNADAPLAQIAYDYWFYEQNPDGDGLDFGPKFNYEHYDANLGIFPAREYVIDALRMWVEQFHIDGIRFDCTRAIKYFDLLEWFHNEAHSRADFKPFYTIAEHVPQDSAIATANGPVDAAWHDNYFRQLACTTLAVSHHGREPFNTSAVLAIMDPKTDHFASGYNTVRYLSNHDEERIMFLLGATALTFDEAAFRRAKLGATLLLTSPGIPMIWMGEEFGQPTDKSMDKRPMNWSLLEQDANLGLFNHYKHLLTLRRENPALIGDSFQVAADMPDRGIIAYKRWADNGNVILVVANLKPEFAGAFSVGDAGLEDGTWREVIYGFDVQVSGGVLSDELAESDVKVYIRQ